ncbi:MAG: hypothetical protein ACI9FU_001097 [Granulosicoccus sp.]|jgi:hypothetical protein
MVARAIIITLFLFNTLGVFAQQPKFDVLRKGLFRSQLSISPGFLFSGGNANVYLHGGFEYFLKNKVSFTGHGFWFIDSQKDKGDLKHNSSVLWGLRYHFPWRKKKIDSYIGLEPGVGFVQAKNSESVSVMKATPLISASAGLTFYVWKYFNFFVETRYVHGHHSSEWNQTFKLDEFRISAGLGWNVNLIRKKS